LNLIAQLRSQGCVSSGRSLQIHRHPSSWFPICSTAAESAGLLFQAHPGAQGFYLCQRSSPRRSPGDQDRFARRCPLEQRCRRLPETCCQQLHADSQMLELEKVVGFYRLSDGEIVPVQSKEPEVAFGAFQDQALLHEDVVVEALDLPKGPLSEENSYVGQV
jgi:hypothetical protein